MTDGGQRVCEACVGTDGWKIMHFRSSLVCHILRAWRCQSAVKIA